MAFFYKGKRKTHLEAGLIFIWCHFRKHHVSKLLSFLLTFGFFSLLFYALKVETIESPQDIRKEGIVMMLREDDPQCRDLMARVARKSPFSNRWDPLYKNFFLKEIDIFIEEPLNLASKYEPKLRELPRQSHDQITLFSIFKTSEQVINSMISPIEENQAKKNNSREPDLELHIIAELDTTKELKPRLPEQIIDLPTNLIDPDWYGQSLMFLIGIDSEGLVQSCIPILGGTLKVLKPTEQQKNLATWLRLQRFKPSQKQEFVFGQLDLTLKVHRE